MTLCNYSTKFIRSITLSGYIPGCIKRLRVAPFKLLFLNVFKKNRRTCTKESDKYRVIKTPVVMTLKNSIVKIYERKYIL